jgi:hypothetical protein
MTGSVEAHTLSRMLKSIDWLRERARFHHEQLPKDVRRYLNTRCGIVDAVIDRHLLGWEGKKITVPIEDRTGTMIGIRSVKMTRDGRPQPTATEGIAAEIYPWQSVERQPNRIVICGSELECLALESRGVLAVCSTGDATQFDITWVALFEKIPFVFACFARDRKGDRAAGQVKSVMPRTKIVGLPEAVGESGDLTDYFGRLQYTLPDFEWLLSVAALDARPGAELDPVAKARFEERARRLMTEVSVARVIGAYTKLRTSGKRLLGRCPLHDVPKLPLVVYPESRTFRCLGCGAEGDAVKFLELMEGMTLGQAVETLEQMRYGDAA